MSLFQPYACKFTHLKFCLVGRLPKPEAMLFGLKNRRAAQTLWMDVATLSLRGFVRTVIGERSQLFSLGALMFILSHIPEVGRTQGNFREW